MKTRSVIIACIFGLIVGFAGAQGPSIEGHVNADLTTVKDAGGKATALQISTAGISSTGTFAVTGASTFAGTQTFTLGAAEYFQLDGATTAQTQTDGVLDLNFASITANAAGAYLTCTTNSGATAATDVFCARMLVTQDDADADAFGLQIILDATANAAANSYEYGISIDCEENSTSACLDGILLTSSGIDAGMVDGIDASAANITNAINIGVNMIASVDDTLDMAVDDTLTFTRNDSGSVTYTCADDNAVADCIYDSGTTGAVVVGSADSSAVTLTDDAGTLAFNGGDVTLSGDETNGNALAKSEFIGLPRIKNIPFGTMANGTTNTVIVDIGDSETPATDWTAVDGDVVMSNDSSFYRHGTASLKMAIAGTATEDDGCVNALGSGDQNWSDDEGFGFWMYSDATMAGSILQLVISDSVAADVKFNIPAYATANVWQWTEIDVTTANTNKDVIEDISITLTATGATQAGVAAWNVYFDFIVKWDVAEEEALAVAIPYDGVMSVTAIDVTSGGATLANLTEYTDYFVHYQSGNDAVVMITNQSATDLLGLALVAYN